MWGKTCSGDKCVVPALLIIELSLLQYFAVLLTTNLIHP